MISKDGLLKRYPIGTHRRMKKTPFDVCSNRPKDPKFTESPLKEIMRLVDTIF